jgi:hypothetical protein
MGACMKHLIERWQAMDNEYDAMVGEQRERNISENAKYYAQEYIDSLPQRNEICDDAIYIAMVYAYKKGASR